VFVLNTDKLKQLANHAGKTLGILGLLFLFYKLFQEYTLEEFLKNFALIMSIMPLLIIINFLSTLLGIYAWYIMLMNYAKKPFPYLVSYYYFAKTEISKYLPGNIFHYVGRQVLASKMGISQKEMAKISALQAFLLLAATLFSSALFALLSMETPGYLLFLMLLAVIIVIIVIIFIYPSFPVFKKVQMNLLLTVSVAMQGLILGLVMWHQSESMSMGLFSQLVSIYIISWLVGFITPGASGGLGIREGTFVAISAFLHVDVTEDIIIFSVLMVRLINIMIDLIMYLSTYALEQRIKEWEE